MRIQWKLTLLVAVIAVGIVAGMAWRTQSLFFDEKVSFVADASVKQIAPVKRLVQNKLEDLKSRLVQFAGGRVALGQGKMRSFGDFDVIALVRPNDIGQWTAEWIEKGESANPEKWPADHELTLLKSLPYSHVRDGEGIWVRLSDRQGAPVYAFMITVEIHDTARAAHASGVGAQPSQLPDDVNQVKAEASGKSIVVGFSSIDSLAALTEDYIGSTSSIYLVDDRGYVASHVNKAHLGASFSDDEIVRDLLKTKRFSATANFHDLDGNLVVGHYERIDRTNLYAVIATPVQTFAGLVRANTFSSAATGLMIGGLGILLMLIFGARLSGALEGAIELIRSVNSGDPVLPFKISNSSDEVGVLTRMLAESSPAALASKLNFGTRGSGEATQTNLPDASNEVTSAGTITKLGQAARASMEPSSTDQPALERRAALEAFNSGLAGMLRDPLLAILGHAQLTKTKSDSPDIRAHAESIEREARHAKELIEKLSNWSGEAAPTVADEKVDLAKVIQTVLAKCKDGLDSDGIEVVQELRRVPVIHGSREQLESVLTHLIDNAREAMQARVEKKLRIQLDFFTDRIFLVVGDTGVGMSRDVKDRAFDPFFKAFQSPKRVGLGLAFVRAALRGMNAVCEIESLPGEGATFTVRLPVSSKEKAAFLVDEPRASNQKSASLEPKQGESLEETFDRTLEQALGLSDEKRGSDYVAPLLMDSDAMSTLDNVSIKSAPYRPPLSTTVQTESAARVAAHFGDDLNDDDADDFEQFSNVAVTQAAEFVESGATLESSGDLGFQVKIRRPKRGS